jgi:class 3 adenylate cyclase
MAETRKLAAILAADVVGYSRLAGSDEERTLARLRALRSDLIDPTIALHHGRVVKRTGDGAPGGLGCVMRHRSRCCGSWDHPSSPMAAVGLQVRSALAIQA